MILNVNPDGELKKPIQLMFNSFGFGGHNSTVIWVAIDIGWFEN